MKKKDSCFFGCVTLSTTFLKKGYQVLGVINVNLKLFPSNVYNN